MAASSFLLSVPDISVAALTYSTAAAYDEDYPVENMFFGERGTYSQLATAGTSTVITWDLGAGFTQSVDHLILGDALTLYNAGVTEVRLQGSSDGSTWVDQLGTAASFLSWSFFGPAPYARDTIAVPGLNDDFAATLAAYRYWRLTLSGGGSHKFPTCKAYFGAFVDLGKEPDFFTWETVDRDADTWRIPRGQVILAQSSHERTRLRVEWDGVTNAAAQNFSEKLLKNPFKYTVFAYTGTYHEVLKGQRLLQMRVIDSECSIERTKVTDFSNVVLVLEEIV